MLIDLHTHTQPLSHDSLLSPDELIEAARAAGLDAVCLTEHDFVWGPEEVRALSWERGRVWVWRSMSMRDTVYRSLKAGASDV